MKDRSISTLHKKPRMQNAFKSIIDLAGFPKFIAEQVKQPFIWQVFMEIKWSVTKLRNLQELHTALPL
jgi:hypothetical protein